MAEPILAIDFGTSTSSAALVTDTEIRLIKEPTAGTWSWPSSVYLDGESLLVGTPAERLKRADPTCYGSEFKRELGRDTAITLGAWSFAPHELITAVLSALHAEAERQAGARISRAVLTVPASYAASDPRRQLMLEAAEGAGFAAAELLDEPVAAASAPAPGQPFAVGDVVLIYDFGGGTFDAAVVRVNEHVNEVLGHASLEDCGGRDVDEKLFRSVQTKGSPRLAELLTPPAGEPADEAAQIGIWRVALELADFTRQMKHQLSDAPRAKDFFTMALLPIEMDRSELDIAVQPLVAQTVECCQTLLSRSGITVEDLSAVLMIGGGSRMPIVTDTLTSELGLPLLYVDDPQVAIVQGAARWASHIPDRKLTPIALTSSEVPLRWDIPGETARLLRWMVEPGKRFEAGTVVAQVRLKDGAIWDLVAEQAGWPVRMHAAPGAPVSAGDWLITTGTPARANRSEPVRLRISDRPQEILRMPHDDITSGVAFSPDSRHLASASWDKTARLWDAANGSELLRMSHKGTVLGIALSPDGRLATASSDGYARVWDPSTGKELLLLSHRKEVTSVVFSTDGRRLATAACDRAARVWDAYSGAEMTQVVHNKEATSVVFSPDGRRLATASRDRTARVWDAVSGAELLRLSHSEMVLGVSFSPDGRRLATASRDNSARLWDVARAAELLRLPHESAVVAVAFSPDGRWLATASSDEWAARVWDTNDGEELLRLPHKGPVRGVAFSRDGRWLATADTDDAARMWNVADAIE